MGYVLCVVGGQSGDEGKGKVLDILSAKCDVAAKGLGASTLGQSLEHEGLRHTLHILPVASIHAKTCVLGAGVLIDPFLLIDEIRRLSEKGIRPRLVISPGAHLIMEWHIALDRSQGQGFSHAGVGPSMQSVAGESAVRASDLVSEDLAHRLRTAARMHLIRLVGYHPMFAKYRYLSLQSIAQLKSAGLAKTFASYVALARKNYSRAAAALGQYVKDEQPVIRKAKFLLVEGTRGSRQDALHGSFAPSQLQTIAAAQAAGLGIGPKAVGDVLGVFKAYESAPQAHGQSETEKSLRKLGAEFETQTGRPKSCGWFDIDEARKATALNSFTWSAVTKLDVLDRFTEIRVIEAGREKIFEGWQADTTGCRSYAGLPSKAKAYLAYIEKRTAPLAIVSVGPSTEETIITPAFMKRLSERKIQWSTA